MKRPSRATARRKILSISCPHVLYRHLLFKIGSDGIVVNLIERVPNHAISCAGAASGYIPAIAGTKPAAGA